MNKILKPNFKKQIRTAARMRKAAWVLLCPAYAMHTGRHGLGEV